MERPAHLRARSSLLIRFLMLALMGGVAGSSAVSPAAAVPPVIVNPPASLPAGRVGVDYGRVIFNGSGGVGRYTWTAAGLPPGLTLRNRIDSPAGQNRGFLSGVPGAGSAGSYNVRLTLTDSAGETATITLPLRIDP